MAPFHGASGFSKLGVGLLKVACGYAFLEEQVNLGKSKALGLGHPEIEPHEADSCTSGPEEAGLCTVRGLISRIQRFEEDRLTPSSKP
jgi:hypothetical protein